MCLVGSAAPCVTPSLQSVALARWFSLSPLVDSSRFWCCIAALLNHSTDVIQGAIRCLCWLLGELSAAEPCIADWTNNVLCLSYRVQVLGFFGRVRFKKWEMLIWTFFSLSLFCMPFGFWRLNQISEVKLYNYINCVMAIRAMSLWRRPQSKV